MCQEFQGGQGENEKIAKLETWSFRRCTSKPVSCSLALKGKLKGNREGVSKQAAVLYCAMWDVHELFSFLRRVKMWILLKENQRTAFGVCYCVCSVCRAN